MIAAVATLGSPPGRRHGRRRRQPRFSRTCGSPTALLGLPDDPSLDLVADFGGTLDWDDLREQMAVSARPGRLDASVGELDGGERRELERLLKEELARPTGRTDRS